MFLKLQMATITHELLQYLLINNFLVYPDETQSLKVAASINDRGNLSRNKSPEIVQTFMMWFLQIDD